MHFEPVAFIVGSAILLWLSRKSLHSPDQHGFYRFFAWEAILGLVVLNDSVREVNPFSASQIASRVLLLLSLFLVITAVFLMQRHGQASRQREDSALYAFEKTTRLVTTGIFGYIRHPMYASLLALAWGIYFKNPNWLGTGIAGFASFCLLLTAKADERECLAYFGPPYAQRTRRFIPYLI